MIFQPAKALIGLISLTDMDITRSFGANAPDGQFNVKVLLSFLAGQFKRMYEKNTLESVILIIADPIKC